MDMPFAISRGSEAPLASATATKTAILVVCLRSVIPSAFLHLGGGHSRPHPGLSVIQVAMLLPNSLSSATETSNAAARRRFPIPTKESFRRNTMAKVKRKLKVGIIGSGAIARDQHLPYWRQLEAEGRVEVLGVCDLVRERREVEAAKCVQAKPFANYDKMLAAIDFDIIDVCTQNRVHAPATIAGLKAGAHVLVEKPMAMNTKECLAMIAAAKAKKRKLMVAQHMRFEPRAEKLKEVVMSGALGRIYTAETKWLRRRGIPGWGKFHLKKESLGGPLIDIGVHMMDLCVWLMGCPKPTAASGKVYRMFGDRPDLFNTDWGTPYPPKEFTVEDYATGFVRFENDITMQMSVSWAANTNDEIENMYIL
ncbi:MAG TPA: Gfo/Idh/MocA family oxidoreductase, partial [Candidatus Hydrogenedentes bacterium]|nr:Gfo/Idh/MocA family oxidoreductase [Candidatus Hydrogenedentota bacterium]